MSDEDEEDGCIEESTTPSRDTPKDRSRSNDSRNCSSKRPSMSVLALDRGSLVAL